MIAIINSGMDMHYWRKYSSTVIIQMYRHPIIWIQTAVEQKLEPHPWVGFSGIYLKALSNAVTCLADAANPRYEVTS